MEKKLNIELPKGITGLSKPNIESPLILPKTLDNLLLKFKEKNYLKTIVIPPSASRNYYTLKIIHRHKLKKYIILINSIYSYYCRVEKDEWMNLHFKELNEKITSIFGSSFQYLPPKTLNSKFDTKDLINLSKEELNAIKYWKSKTIGQIIFNGYD